MELVFSACLLALTHAAPCKTVVLAMPADGPVLCIRRSQIEVLEWQRQNQGWTVVGRHTCRPIGKDA